MTTNVKCENCKCWSKQPSRPDGWGFCNKPSDDDSLIATTLYDGILTAPSFGCVQFEAKPE